MEAWSAGRLIAGKYRLVAKLGEGGMGAVWRADHATLGSPVAVKLIHPAALESTDAVARFLNEARAAALLRSPHVVQILDHGVDEGVPFMVMELLEGESLARRLARAGALSLAETARLFTQVARAMTRAHEAGIVHRDLKPDNIFIVRNDDEDLAKVLDFGIAKVTHVAARPAEHLSTQTGALLGTPYYMSPEHVRGQPIDLRTDLWALAVIAYECVVGAVPFDGATIGDLLLKICTEPVPRPSALAPVPPGFDAWFLRGVARAREERFQSAREMAEQLRALADLPGASLVSTRPPSPSPVRSTAADTLVAPVASAPTEPVTAPRTITTSTAYAGSASSIPDEPAPPRSRARSLAAAALGLVLLAGAGVGLGRRAPGDPSVSPTTALGASAALTSSSALPAAASAPVPLVVPASAPPPVASASAPAPTASPELPSARPSASAPRPVPPAPAAKPRPPVTAAPTAPPRAADPLAF